MARTKQIDRLNHPVDRETWTNVKAAERITYAQPQRMSWRDGGTYGGVELQHRSMHNRLPSIVMGKRV